MSFSLLGEIARKKQELEAAKQLTGGTKKYVKRGDLEKQLAGQGAPPAGSDSTPSSAAPIDTTTPSSASIPAASVEPKVIPKRAEVINRLRRLGQPVTLFGETDEERYARLVAVEEEKSRHDRSDVAVAGVYEYKAADSSHSGQKRLRADSEAGDLASPDEKAGGGFLSRTGGAAGTEAGEGGEDDEDEGAGHAARPRVVAADADGWKGKDDHKYIHRFFKGMLNEWESALAAKSEGERDTAACRAERRTQKQTRDYMRAFFKMCNQRALPEDVLRFAVEIVDDCRALEYRRAGDAYWRMAIGNAAWPIGVSAVGLHERGAREKVGEGQAHVMNDEAARKYITSIKRIISFAQSKYPSDPSKMIFS